MLGLSLLGAKEEREDKCPSNFFPFQSTTIPNVDSKFSSTSITTTPFLTFVVIQSWTCACAVATFVIN